jgi:DNA-binding MarR family transcriptional regulator
LLERIIVAGVAITTRALSETQPDLDLTFPQWRVLLIVGDHEQGAILSEIAMRVGVTLPATSRQVHRLAARGLLEIRRDERDRRAARVRLSPEGCALRSQIIANRRRRIEGIARSVVVSRQTLDELEQVAEAFKYHR